MAWCNGYKDCIHEKVCDMPIIETSKCEHFKNKTDFVEVVRCGNCKNYNNHCSYGERGDSKHGKWIYNTDDFTPKMRCSACGYNKPMVAGEGIEQEPNNFCPHCGADMRGDENA